MFEKLKIKIFGIQPAAKLTTNQLEKLIAREFPKHIDEVTLKFYKVKGDNPNGINRISAAIVKLANKDLSSLDRFIEMASVDYRDILSQAEYPRCLKLGFDEFDKKKMKGIYLEDWREYSKWLND
jgi:hypothetical protein